MISDSQKKIISFRSRSEENYIFACQASLPLILTIDLLYHLWNNFKQYQYVIYPEKFFRIPHFAVSDLILSNLCKEVGFELYEMESEIRNILLSDLKENLGEKRLNTIAKFLEDYAQSESRLSNRKNLKDIHNLTALSFLNPAEMEKQIIEKINKKIKNEDIPDREKINIMSFYDVLALGYDSDLKKISSEVTSGDTDENLSPILIEENDMNAPGIMSVKLPMSLKKRIQYKQSSEKIPSSPTEELKKDNEQKNEVEEKISKESDNWIRISVRKNKNETITFEFRTSEKKDEIYTIDINNKLIEEVWKGYDKWTPETGKIIFELMIPNEMKKIFNKENNIIWILDRDTLSYPWELLTIDGKALCLSVKMIRQISTKTYQPVNVINKNKALIIADPNIEGFEFGTQLPGAFEEGQSVHNLLLSNGFETNLQLQTKTSNIIQAIFSDDYKLMHFAGHGTASGVLIGKDIYITAKEISQLSSIPELVFVNCDQVGSEFASKLIEIGVKAVIVGAGSINDHAAKLFSNSFYENIFSGKNFSESVLNARRDVFEKFGRSLTWGIYQCYGDPFYTIQKQGLKTIKIFLSSTSELKEDRDQFQIFISEQNHFLHNKGIFLELILWENYLDAMSPYLQEKYNKGVEECDIFVMLVFNKVGKYSVQEFDRAFEKFTVSNKIKVYTFFKKPFTTESTIDVKSLWAFEEKVKELGHYATNYTNTDDLIFNFKKQLEILIERGSLLNDSKLTDIGKDLDVPQYEYSIDKYRIATELNPNDDSAFNNWGLEIYKLAKLKFDEELYKESFEKYQRATKLNPENDFAFINWGNAIYDLAKLKNDEELYKESFEKYQRATELNPKNESAYNNWGFAIYELAKLKNDEKLYEQSVEKYNKVLQLYPKNISALNNLAKVFDELGEYEKARDLLEKSLPGIYEVYKTNPQDVSIKNGLAVAYEELGGIYERLEQLEDALKFYKDTANLFEELYTTFPQDVSFKNGLGISYSKLGGISERMGRLNESLKFYQDYNILSEELYKTYPQDVSFKSSLAISYDRLGGIYEKMGNLEEALKIYQEETKLFDEFHKSYPQDVSFKNGLVISYERLGVIYEKMSNLKEALKFYLNWNILSEELYKTFPQDASVKVGLAISYERLGGIYEKMGNFEEALKFYQEGTILFDELHKSHSQDVSYKEGLAISNERISGIYEKMGEYEKSRDLLQKSLESDLKNFGEKHPNVSRSQSNLALVYEHLGEHEKARELLEKALSTYIINFGENDTRVSECRANLDKVNEKLTKFKKIKIIVSYSFDSKKEIEGIDIEIRRKNKTLVDQNVYLDLKTINDITVGKNFHDELNKVISDADIYVIIAGTKIEKNSFMEFDYAYTKYINNELDIYFYLKESESKPRQPMAALLKKVTDLNVFRFKDITELWNNLNKRIDRYLSDGLEEKSIDKNQLAKGILKKAKEDKATLVDLGNCGLDGYLPNELFDEYFIENLEVLSLGHFFEVDSNKLYIETKNTGEANSLSGEELESLSKFKNLSRLWINGLNLKSMSFINGCNKLKELNLGSNQISKIEGLNENLKTLNLSDNEIQKIENLNENLKYLDLSGNEISKIEGLNENLQTLNIGENKIHKIEGLNENLQILNLRVNHINKIENLNENLQILNLAVNQITKIEQINTNLEWLNLSENQISKVEGLSENLQTLNLAGNEIHTLENLIPFLKRKNNPLEVVCINNANLTGNKINVFNNPITIPPIEIVKNGTEAVLEYFQNVTSGLRKETVFLSYSVKDFEIASKLNVSLQRQFQKVFDYDDEPGKPWSKVRFDRIATSDIGIIFLSQNYLNSDNLTREAQEMVSRHDRGELKLFPIRLYENERLYIPLFLQNIQLERFYDYKNEDEISKEIVEAVSIHHEKPNGDFKNSNPERNIEPNYHNNSVFISYNHEDKQIAYKIADQFKEMFIDVFISDSNLRQGDELTREIFDSIDNSCCFIPIITNSVNNEMKLNRYYKNEWNYACQYKRKEEIFPIRTRDFKRRRYTAGGFSIETINLLLNDSTETLLIYHVISPPDYKLNKKELDEIKKLQYESRKKSLRDLS